MKKVRNSGLRIADLLRFYVGLLLLFILEKPLFMLCAGSGNTGDYSFTDFFRVIFHGFPIDAAVAGYLVIFPLLVLAATIWKAGLNVKPVLKTYGFIVSFILAAIFVGDTVLYPFWGYKMDAQVFFYLKSPKDAIASVSIWMTVAGIAVTCLLVWVIYRYVIDRSFRPYGKYLTVERPYAVAVFWLLLTLPVFVSIRGGLKESTMNVGHAYFSTNQFLNHSAVNPAFSLLSSVGKSDDYSSYFDYLPEEERSQLADSAFVTDDSLTCKLLKTDRPNVLVVVMEGFGGDFSYSLSGVPDVTPRLDSLASEGVFFSNCYAGSFRTDRGMVCVMNGHPGLPTVSIMKLPVKSRNLPSLSGTLAANGYATEFMYGGDINFTNMKSYLWSNGYQKIVADTDFSVAERHSSAWGVNDGITFSRLFTDIKEKTDTLWHIGFLSLSSHEPFDVPYSRLEEKIPNSFAYADSCLGSLVDSLRSSSAWNNLLMLIIPDHGFRYPQEGSMNSPHVHRIPVVWTGGAVKEHVVVDQLMNQMDVAATLLAQMGLSHDDFLFSRNVLSPAYEPFAFYTFNNGFCYIDESGYTLFDNISEKVIESSGNSDEFREKRGKAILQTLYDDLERR